MRAKLTLTIEKEVINVAKEYAKDNSQTLSDIVENYLKVITAKRKKIKPTQLSPRVQRLRGIIDANSSIDNKQILRDELVKKFGM